MVKRIAVKQTGAERAPKRSKSPPDALPDATSDAEEDNESDDSDDESCDDTEVDYPFWSRPVSGDGHVDLPDRSAFALSPPDGADVVVSPTFKAFHRSWGDFLAYRKAYEAENFVRMYVKYSNNAARRNEDMEARRQAYKKKIVELKCAQAVARSSGSKAPTKRFRKPKHHDPIPDYCLMWRRVFLCTHGGKRKSRGKGERPLQRIRSTNCQFRIVAEVTQFNDEWVVAVRPSRYFHNHDVCAEVYNSYAQNRLLKADDPLRDDIKLMIRGQGKAVEMFDYLVAASGKPILMRDIHNMIAEYKQEKAGDVSEDVRVADFQWMKTGMAITHFKETNPCWVDVKVVVVDKDFKEIEVISRFLPSARILLCHFHVLKYLKNEMRKVKYGRHGQSVYDKWYGLTYTMTYCTTEEEFVVAFETLKSAVAGTKIEAANTSSAKETSKCFWVYFELNWGRCREMWANYARQDLPHFGNNTNNRLESNFGTLKREMPDNLTIPECLSYLGKRAARDQHKYKTRVRFVGSVVHHNYDDEMNAVLKFCTPWVAEALKKEYDRALATTYEMTDLSDGTVSVRLKTDCRVDRSQWRGTCSFATTMHLPCRHVIGYRRASQLTPVIPSFAIAPRWMLQSSALKESLPVGLSTVRHSRMPDASRKPALRNNEKYLLVRPILDQITNELTSRSTDQFKQELATLKAYLHMLKDGTANAPLQSFVLAEDVHDGSEHDTDDDPNDDNMDVQRGDFPHDQRDDAQREAEPDIEPPSQANSLLSSQLGLVHTVEVSKVAMVEPEPLEVPPLPVSFVAELKAAGIDLSSEDDTAEGDRAGDNFGGEPREEGEDDEENAVQVAGVEDAVEDDGGTVHGVDGDDKEGDNDDDNGDDNGGDNGGDGDDKGGDVEDDNGDLKDDPTADVVRPKVVLNKSVRRTGRPRGPKLDLRPRNRPRNVVHESDEEPTRDITDIVTAIKARATLDLIQDAIEAVDIDDDKSKRKRPRFDDSTSAAIVVPYVLPQEIVETCMNVLNNRQTNRVNLLSQSSESQEDVATHGIVLTDIGRLTRGQVLAMQEYYLLKREVADGLDTVEWLCGLGKPFCSRLATLLKEKRPDEFVPHCEKQELPMRCLYRARGTLWFGEDIIHAYGRTLEREFDNCTVISGSSLLSSRLALSDRRSLGLKETITATTSTKPFVCIPINVNANHWTCIVVDRVLKKIIVYDSLGMASVKPILEFNATRLVNMVSDPKIPFATEFCTSPRQSDGYNCGLFVCIFMLRTVSEDPWTENSVGQWNLERARVLDRILTL